MKHLTLSAICVAVALSCSGLISKEPVEEYRLTGNAAESWRTIKDDFHRNGFYPCLKKKNVTVSCGGCTGVMLRGIIHIDREGKVSGFTKTYDRYCGGPMPSDVEECLVNHIRSVFFPRELRGMSIAVDLGRALRC